MSKASNLTHWKCATICANDANADKELHYLCVNWTIKQFFTGQSESKPNVRKKNLWMTAWDLLQKWVSPNRFVQQTYSGKTVAGDYDTTKIIVTQMQCGAFNGYFRDQLQSVAIFEVTLVHQDGDHWIKSIKCNLFLIIQQLTAMNWLRTIHLWLSTNTRVHIKQKTLFLNRNITRIQPVGNQSSQVWVPCCNEMCHTYVTHICHTYVLLSLTF